MKHKNSATLYAYWNHLRADRVAPLRFEIEPSQISAILPYTFILERLDAETFRFRLAGTRMCDIFGHELRGTNFLDGWAAIDRPPLLRQLSVLSREGAAAIITMRIGACAGESVECEVPLLPLRHTHGAIDRVLGSFSPLTAPSWLGEIPVASKSLIGGELVWPARAPVPLLPRRPVEVRGTMEARNARIVRSEHRQFRVFEGGLSGVDDKA